MSFAEPKKIAASSHKEKSNQQLKLVSIFVKHKNNLLSQFELLTNNGNVYYSANKSVKIPIDGNSKISLFVVSNGILIKKNFDFSKTKSIPDTINISPNSSTDKAVNLYVYNNSKPISSAQVFIINKEIPREVFVGKTDKRGFLSLLITKGEYYLKIAYGANNPESMEYAFAKVKVDNDKTVKLNVNEFGEVYFNILYTFGGEGLNDRLYIGLDSIKPEQKIACYIGQRRSVKFAEGNYGKVWIFAGNPYYSHMYCLAYKPTQNLVISKSKKTLEYNLRIDTQNIKITNILRWNEKSSKWEKTTLSSVYEGDELRVEIFIPTQSQYILGMCALNYYDKEFEKTYHSIAGVSSMPPCYKLVAYIIDENGQKYNINAVMSNLFNSQQNTFTIFISNIKGTPNSQLYLEINFDPYDISHRTFNFPLNIFKR